MRARPLSGRVAVLLLVMLLAAACRGGGADQPTATPSPEPTTPVPFTLRVEDVVLASMDNAEILGGTVPQPPSEVADDAVAATREALERYLNGQFVDEATRFGTHAPRALLQPGVFDSLTPEQRHALGHLALPVASVRTGRASGTATVLMEGERVYAVSMEYEARLTIRFGEEGERLPVVQRGSVLFTAPSWGVESFDLTLDAPPPPPPPPSPSEEATP